MEHINLSSSVLGNRNLQLNKISYFSRRFRGNFVWWLFTADNPSWKIKIREENCKNEINYVEE